MAGNHGEGKDRDNVGMTESYKRRHGMVINRKRQGVLARMLLALTIGTTLTLVEAGSPLGAQVPSADLQAEA